MRWAEWTAGGKVPDDVLDDVLEMLGRGLAPPAAAVPGRDPGLSAGAGDASSASP
jgi:hypothetical protein